MAYDRHYWQTIDAENRIKLPKGIRQVSDSSQYVISRGLNACLLLYPIERWKKMETEVVQLNDLCNEGDEVRQFYRRLFMWALDVATDENGRIEVPTELKNVTDLDQEVLVLVVDTHVELWDPGRYDMYLDKKADDAAQAKRLNG